LIFPCAVLTAYALTYVAGKWLRTGLILIAAAGLLFCYAKIRDYRASTASRVLGRWLADQTMPTEFIFTNIKTLSAPIQSWDNEFIANTRLAADRLLFAGATDEQSLRDQAGPFTNEFPSTVCFLLVASQPLDTNLQQQLNARSLETRRTELEVPPQRPAVFKTARATLWRLLGKRANQYTFKPGEASGETNVFNVELYRLPSAFVGGNARDNPGAPSRPRNAPN
jgi:hypothetical protein